MSLLSVVVVVALMLTATAFVPTSSRFSVATATKTAPVSESALFAHHVNDKVVKRKMSRRPRKSRQSDITRSNVNMDKCITKVVGAPAEYTIVSAADYELQRAEALKFWESGDPSAEWLEITAADMEVTLPQNIDPLPVGGVQKKPPLLRSGSDKHGNWQAPTTSV